MEVASGVTELLDEFFLLGSFSETFFETFLEDPEVVALDAFEKVDKDLESAAPSVEELLSDDLDDEIGFFLIDFLFFLVPVETDDDIGMLPFSLPFFNFDLCLEEEDVWLFIFLGFPSSLLVLTFVLEVAAGR